jgi:hypothetical protein
MKPTTGFISIVKYHGDMHQPKLRTETWKYSTPYSVSRAKVKYCWSDS